MCEHGGGVGYQIAELSASHIYIDAMSTVATCYPYVIHCLLCTNWPTRCTYVCIWSAATAVASLTPILTYLVNKKLYPCINAIFVLALCSFELGNLLLQGG